MSPPSGDSAFDLCQDGKCVKAGKVATFGVKDGKSGKKKFLTQQDVTDVLVKQGWT